MNAIKLNRILFCLLLFSTIAFVAINTIDINYDIEDAPENAGTNPLKVDQIKQVNIAFLARNVFDSDGKHWHSAAAPIVTNVARPTERPVFSGFMTMGGANVVFSSGRLIHVGDSLGQDRLLDVGHGHIVVSAQNGSVEFPIDPERQARLEKFRVLWPDRNASVDGLSYQEHDAIESNNIGAMDQR